MFNMSFTLLKRSLGIPAFHISNCPKSTTNGTAFSLVLRDERLPVVCSYFGNRGI
jgi:hypothetical protein